MPDVVLTFEVHQPYRLNVAFRNKLNEVISQGREPAPDELERMYFDEELNKAVFQKVASRCYKPATALFLRLLDEHHEFRVSFSFSGVLLEQAERWAPDTLELFKSIARHRHCEVLGQTYYHSLAFMLGADEFVEQVEEHRRVVRDLLGVWPRVFENTELIYDNHLAKLVAGLGFNVVVTEGSEKLLGWRSPNYVYRARGADIKVLLRNYRLSDDVGFRFASRGWEQYPLTAEKYSSWLASTPGQVVCIFIDYETIGEHFPRETGIFEFFEWLPREAAKLGLSFATPSEAISRYEPVDYVDAAEPVSWADLERDTSAWLGNPMQVLALARAGALELPVKVSGSPVFLRLWRLLTISDHYYYMSTKGGGPGEVHSYFSPYPSPFTAFAAFLDALSDLERRVFEAAGGELSEAPWVKSVGSSEAFQFYMGDDAPLPYVARSGLDLLGYVKSVPARSLEYHVERGHLAEWVKWVLGLEELSAFIEGLKGLRGSELRLKLIEGLTASFMKIVGSRKRRGSRQPSERR